jgi:PAS domain S-box-containing protein
MANQSISETENRLRSENEELQQRLTVEEETLYAIRNGEVDAIVVSGAEGTRIFSLTSAETPYRIMVEEMQEGAATLMADTTIIYCNSRFAELVACPAEQIIGASFSQFISENEKPAFTRLFNASLSGKSSGEITWVSPENEIRYFHLSFSPLPPEVTGDVCVIVSDFTERKQAEEVQKQSEVRYRSLLTNLEAGIVVHAPDTSIIMNNLRASELLGLSEDQMKGRLAVNPDWKFIHPDGVPLQVDEYPVNRVISSGKAFSNMVLGVIQPAGKTLVWLTVNGFPAYDDRGEISEVIISFIDITERKKAEDELLKKIDELLLFQRLTVGRELKMIELKKEINELLKGSGKNEKYRIVE